MKYIDNIEPISDISELISLLDLSRLSVLFVEGFDKVGKTTIIDQIKKDYPQARIYQPSWSDFSSPMSQIPYNHRKYVGLSLLDILNTVDNISTGLVVVDRSILSSIVYDSLSLGDTHADSANFLILDEDKLRSYASEDILFQKYIEYGYKNLDIIHLLIEHSSLEGARVFYNRTCDREEICEFNNFDNYISSYNNFMLGFSSIVSKVPYPIYVADSINLLSE